jgi:predicted lactoylglutathione lyase
MHEPGTEEKPRMPSVTVCLPIADRRTALDFYTAAFALRPEGEELGSDGIPEPLQFGLGGWTRLMLIPRGGFGWVAAPNAVAEAGTSEVVLDLGVADDDAVHATVSAATAAGARVVAAPEAKPWAYTATVADPDGHLWTITSAAPRP